MKPWIAIVIGVAILATAATVYTFVWGIYSPYPTWVVSAGQAASSGDRVAFDLSLKGRDDDPKIEPLLEIRCDAHRLGVALYVGDVQRMGDFSGPASVSIAELFSEQWNDVPTWHVDWMAPEGSSVLARSEPAAFVRQLLAHPWFIAGHGMTDGNRAISAKFHVEGLKNYTAKLDEYCNFNEQADTEEAEAALSRIGLDEPRPPQVFKIYFEFASVVSTSEALDVIKIAAAQIVSTQWEHVTVVGYADTLEGDPAGWQEAAQDCLASGEGRVQTANGPRCPDPMSARRLSVLRARAVADALVRFGVRREILTAVGAGSEHQAVETGPRTREPLNRRAIIALR